MAATESLRRLRYAWQLRTGRFRSSEPEWARLSEWVRPASWTIDVGANVGHYTSKLSELVGPSGRVIAVEPVPETFRLLAANSRHFSFPNVTLLQAAASCRAQSAAMQIGRSHYESRLCDNGTMPVVALSLGWVATAAPAVSFVKVDVEGHEVSVLEGLRPVLQRWRPVVVCEARKGIAELLGGLGYAREVVPDSPNRIYVHGGEEVLDEGDGRV